MYKRQLREVIRKKPEKNRHAIKRLYDNASHVCSHKPMTCSVVHRLSSLEPDLVPTDFHLFVSLIDAIRGTTSFSDTEVVKAACDSVIWAWVDVYKRQEEGLRWMAETCRQWP